MRYPSLESTAKQTTEFTVRRMQPEDRDTAVRLTQAEGWPHRREDWDFHCLLGQGWIASTADGAMVGTILWWSYGSAAGAAGLLVVDRRYRGNGIGRRLIEAIIDEAGPRTVQSVATRSGIRVLGALGFRKIGMVQQWQGVPSAIIIEGPTDLILRTADQTSLPSLCELDERAFGAKRFELLASILTQNDGVLAEKDGQLVGFGLIRPAGRGMVIGPVVASDESIAKTIVSRLLTIDASFTRIDIPANANGLAEYLQQSGLILVDQAPVLKLGEGMSGGQSLRSFAMASQSLG